MKFTLKEIIHYCTKINKRVEKGEDPSEIADLIIKFENPEFIYRFALYVKGAPIEKLTNATIELADEWVMTDDLYGRKYPNLTYLTQFAQNVKNAPVEKLADKLCTYGVYGKDEYVKFARDVKGAPIEKLADSAIKVGYFDLLENFAKEVKTAPVDKITDKYLSMLDNFESEEIVDRVLHFSKTARNAPMEKLTKYIIEHCKAQDIYKFALQQKRADIEKLANAVIRKGEVRYIQSFARNVKEAPVEKLADGLISKLNRKLEYELPTGYPSRELYTFARYVKDAPVEKLADALIKILQDYNDKKETATLVESYSKNFGFDASPDKELTEFPINEVAKDICNFGINIEGAPIDKLANALLTTNNKRLIIRFAQQAPNAPTAKMMQYVAELNNVM